jgi:parallel beta-helix repeat protein
MANTAVTWSVNGIASGNASVGTITGSGATVTYNAPAKTGTFTVSAASSANSAIVGKATVTVQTAGSTSTNSGNLGLSPSAPTAVGSGGRVTFGTSVGGVVWSVDGISGGNSTVGTISSAGVYTCPSASAKALHTITATLASNTDQSQSVRILTVAGSTTVNAKTQYGAAGDGVHDDTSAINNALAAAGTGICYLPAGTYLVNPPYDSPAIRIPGHATLLCAPGAVLQCATQSSSSEYAVIALSNSDSAVVGGTLKGDRVARNLPDYEDGSGSDFEVGEGITVGNGSNLWAVGVTSQDNCCDGIYIHDNASSVQVSDCTFSNNRRNGTSLVSCKGVSFQYCTFQTSNGNDPGAGVDLEPNAGSSVSNVSFLSCNVVNNAGGGIEIGPSVADGPSPYGNGSASCTNVTVTGCTITGNGGANYDYGGFRCVASSAVTISGNTIANNLSDGISLTYGCIQFTVTGNTITGNQGVGILVGGGSGSSGECAGTQVNGNTVSNNGDGQISGTSNSGATIGSNP